MVPFSFSIASSSAFAGAQAASLRMGGNVPSFANNARQRQAASHVSSLDDTHWMDMDDLYSILPRHTIVFKAFHVYVCMYVSLWSSKRRTQRKMQESCKPQPLSDEP